MAFDVNELDFENIGEWPKVAKAIFLAVCCAILMGVFYKLVLEKDIKVLETKQQKEVELRQKFEAKAALASNLPVYKAQLEQMNEVFFTLLQQLPASHEIAGLIDELSFLGTDSGLKFQTIRWAAEVEHEFSTELPIQIVVEGQYDQLGQFVSDIAGLPRIVVLDDIMLSRKGESKEPDRPENLLVMSMKAKTYRYKDVK